jgi:peptidoglycan/LPS O-acetylase OafA/YrhL
VSWLQLLGTCFFVNNYLPFHEWYLAHFWSLAVEEHFYLLFPAVLAISGLRLARWIIIAAAVAFACWRSLDQRMGFLTQLLPEVYPQHRTDYCLDALFIGCWVALLADAYRSEFDRWPLLLMGCGGFCVLTVRLAGYFIIPVFFLNLAISFVLITTVLHSQTWIGRILELPPLRWIGRLSYSLYLWQQLFCVARDGSYFFQQWPWNLLATFTCAILSYYFLELPMIRLGHRLNRSASPGSSEEKSAAKRDLSIVATA